MNGKNRLLFVAVAGLCLVCFAVGLVAGQSSLCGKPKVPGGAAGMDGAPGHDCDAVRHLVVTVAASPDGWAYPAKYVVWMSNDGKTVAVHLRDVSEVSNLMARIHEAIHKGD